MTLSASFPRPLLAACTAALALSACTRGALPTTVMAVRTTSVYTQCPKALVRSHLWDAARFRDPADLPTTGAIMQAILADGFDGEAYDRAYPERLARTLY